MKRKLVIFGTGDLAQLAHYYFTTDSEYDVVAFTVDKEFLVEREFCGLPVVGFEEVAGRYGPEDHAFFVALGYASLNEVRKRKFEEASLLGYELVSYISSKASVLNGYDFGKNCFVLEDNTIQPFVSVGDNVVLWSGNHIGHHSKIRDHCFLASHIVVSGGVDIGESCFIGVNATLRDRIKVGERCIIGAGALLLSDAEAGGVYLGTETERSRVPSSRLRKV
ncbi:acetyltransferase [Shinella sp.]|uniref:acetyltransferase n=1 Tax=Shinella sp. TaxID=1870904 RepID=UPI0039E4093C